MIRLLFCAFVLVLGTAGANAATPAPRGPAVDAALGYVRALGQGQYATSYAMLSSQDQKYFGNAANFGSVFTADRFKVSAARALAVRRDGAAQIVTVREDASYFDHGTQMQRVVSITIPLAVVRENGAFKVRDDGHPYRAVTPQSEVVSGGIRVTVRKVSYFLRRVEVIVTFVNEADGFATLLPYRRTTLRDEQNVYRLYETRDWFLTDRQLFLGLHLALNARYSGTLNFETRTRLDDRARTFTLVIAPTLRDGGEAPFELALPPITVPTS